MKNKINQLAVFLVIFSLLNVNISLIQDKSTTIWNLVSGNLTTVGAIALLMGLAQSVLKKDGKINSRLLIIAAAAFAAAILINLGV